MSIVGRIRELFGAKKSSPEHGAMTAGGAVAATSGGAFDDRSQADSGWSGDAGSSGDGGGGGGNGGGGGGGV